MLDKQAQWMQHQQGQQQKHPEGVVVAPVTAMAANTIGQQCTATAAASVWRTAADGATADATELPAT